MLNITCAGRGTLCLSSRLCARLIHKIIVKKSVVTSNVSIASIRGSRVLEIFLHGGSLSRCISRRRACISCLVERAGTQIGFSMNFRLRSRLLVAFDASAKNRSFCASLSRQRQSVLSRELLRPLDSSHFVHHGRWSV